MIDGLLRALASRGITEHTPPPIIETNLLSAPGEGFSYGYFFAAEIEVSTSPLVPGFRILVIGGRQYL